MASEELVSSQDFEANTLLITANTVLINWLKRHLWLEISVLNISHKLTPPTHSFAKLMGQSSYARIFWELILQEEGSLARHGVLSDESTTIYLKVTTVHEAPRLVSDHDVPIFTASRPACTPSQWDLTTQQVNFICLTRACRWGSENTASTWKSSAFILMRMESKKALSQTKANVTACI